MSTPGAPVLVRRKPWPPEPPFVFFDGTRGPASRSFLASAPSAILTELDGRFVELPGGRAVDPSEWLLQNEREILAGFLGYELAWYTLDPRALMPRSRAPRLWIGRFDSLREVDDLELRSGGSLSPIVPDVDGATYGDNVAACVGDIWDGELFEINYTERFRARWAGSAPAFYQRLREVSTGGWFGLLDAGAFAVASASPEAFLDIRDGRVVTRPIKGTRPRSDDPKVDAALAGELVASEKDRAENVMIVDLMRNDLSRVCRPGSVGVDAVCALESFAGVHHLVSTVHGELAAGITPLEALLSCFPAGSITGAPKLRAIEIAAEREGSPRGPYTGSMFVSHPDGWLASNVLIRTATLHRTAPELFDVDYGAGGAVVADSIPEAEWDEALTKTAPLRRVAR